MENEVINYKGYVISTEEDTKRGIFFRNPLQKVDFVAFDGDGRFSPYEYKVAIKNPLRRIYEILLGNGNVVKNIEQWYKSCDFAGFTANILCSPIHFKRKYRKLKAVCIGDDNIQKINVYGYEGEYNICGGCCDKEKTSLKFKTGKTMKLKRTGTYHFIYPFVIENIIDTGSLENDTE